MMLSPCSDSLPRSALCLFLSDNRSVRRLDCVCTSRYAERRVEVVYMYFFFFLLSPPAPDFLVIVIRGEPFGKSLHPQFVPHLHPEGPTTTARLIPRIVFVFYSHCVRQSVKNWEIGRAHV